MFLTDAQPEFIHSFISRGSVHLLTALKVSTGRRLPANMLTDNKIDRVT